MFKIYDGREHFYQWDLDRKLIVEDKSITQVHFSNSTSSYALLRNVYEVNGMYLVDVPNLLLQDNWDIKVYGFDSNYTKHSASYDVIARARPENYVYTEKEQLLWEQLNERIDEIAAIPQPDLSKYALKSEIPSISGLATEKYVDDAIANINIPETDLTNYYTKEEIDSKFSAIPTYQDGNEVAY